MLIDLNDPQQFTVANVAKLIGSVNDGQTWQVYVTKAGLAGIRPHQTSIPNDELFRLESWGRGTNHVGSAAAQDESWVKRIYAVLAANWPNPSSTYIDSY